MGTGASRRGLLKGSVGAFVGALVSVAAAQDADAATDAAAAVAHAGPGRRSFIGSVVSQTGASVRVSIPSATPLATAMAVTVPMQDFPDGWVFRSGDRVLVMRDSLGHPLAATPLVRKIMGTAESCSKRAGARTLTVDGVELILQDASVCPDESPEAAVSKGDGRRFFALAIENDDGGPPSCFGFRREA